MNVKELFNLDGKVAIITGGAGLYGKSICAGLSEAGATCIVASRNEEKCREAANRIKSQGDKATGMMLDLTDDSSIYNFCEKVIAEFGKIDILVNNALTRDGFKNIEDVTREDLKKSQNVNSSGLIILSKYVLKQMRFQRAGKIINISSIMGVVGPNFDIFGHTGKISSINYAFDKWGMIGLTKWMANFYGKFNINVNCISPGGYYTENMDEEIVNNYKRLTPLGRMVSEDDIKGAAVLLASKAGDYITGHNLVVDGGWTSW